MTSFRESKLGLKMDYATEQWSKATMQRKSIWTAIVSPASLNWPSSAKRSWQKSSKPGTRLVSVHRRHYIEVMHKFSSSTVCLNVSPSNVATRSMWMGWDQQWKVIPPPKLCISLQKYVSTSAKNGPHCVSIFATYCKRQQTDMSYWKW